MTNVKPRPITELAPLLIAFVVAIILLFVGKAAQVVIIALLLAYILDPVVTFLEARGMSRGLATLSLIFGLGAILAGCASLLIPAILEQLKALQSGATTHVASSAVEQMQELLRDKLSFLGLGSVDLGSKIEELKRTLGEKAFEFMVKDSLELVISTVTIPFMMFFFLKDGRDLKKKIVSMVPNRYFEFSLDLLYKMDVQLGNYLRGQFVDAVTFGGLSIVALWILGVNYFVFLGAFAGLANLIPYVGPIAGMVPAAIVAVLSTGNLGSAVSVVVAFVILKFLDDFAVQPLVVASSVEMHPVLVLIAIMIGGELFGILGMLLAVPVAGFFKVVLQEGVSTYRKYRFS
jgi:putative permease